MKTKIAFLVFTFYLFKSFLVFGQKDFNVEQYKKFLESNANLTAFRLTNMHPLNNEYLDSNSNGGYANNAYYLDSIESKFALTLPEKELLYKNYFMVTERLSYPKFEDALSDIYNKDLPVFVSTDAILQTLHQSYDNILKELEAKILKTNLTIAITRLYNTIPTLQKNYASSDITILTALEDADLYVTTAYSLITNKIQKPHIVSEAKVNEVWNDILNEKMVAGKQLFAEHTRNIDYSQFKVRGHYVEDYVDSLGNAISLKPYFKAMMWLGRIDFYLTAPPIFPPEEPWSEADIKRMNLGAFLLNELLDKANARELVGINNEIIDYLVGKSDNLTLTEFSNICNIQKLTSARDLQISNKYSLYKTALLNSPEAKQAILSDLFTMDPFDSIPEELPISFKLMGQRFIVDSYVFSNLVYDKVIYNNSKIFRMMPDPLDAMFVLGNNSALPLLYNELQTYHYSLQLASLRYLVDSHDSLFWNNSLYNCWLQAIRNLNPAENIDIYPPFMQTVAWQQEKLNTQLASWTQLRHDNLLYAKQSYTGSVPSCSYPYSYVEPYPDFYGQISNFAGKAAAFFSTSIKSTGKNVDNEIAYFSKLKTTCNILKSISTKEIAQQPLDSAEISFLKSMINYDGFGFGCGGGGFGGWYVDLIYGYKPRVANDYLIVDVHTQPTDEMGNVVGKVLHAGVGKVNLGIFLAPAPSNSNKLTAFIGPVMSYYNKTTNYFYRLTDQEWQDFVDKDSVPVRPDWVNIYLANKYGDPLAEGRNINKAFGLLDNVGVIKANKLICFPNPSNGVLTLQIPFLYKQPIKIWAFDYTGRQILTQTLPSTKVGEKVSLNLENLPVGVYLVKLSVGKEEYSGKVLLVK